MQNQGYQRLGKVRVKFGYKCVHVIMMKTVKPRKHNLTGTRLCSHAWNDMLRFWLLPFMGWLTISNNDSCNADNNTSSSDSRNNNKINYRDKIFLLVSIWKVFSQWCGGEDEADIISLISFFFHCPMLESLHFLISLVYKKFMNKKALWTLSWFVTFMQMLLEHLGNGGSVVELTWHLLIFLRRMLSIFIQYVKQNRQHPLWCFVIKVPLLLKNSVALTNCIVVLAFFCRSRKVLATNLILPSILGSRNGVMIISISRYISY